MLFFFLNFSLKLGSYFRQAEQSVSYQNTPSENFFMAIDRAGKLAEVGWFLYPDMNFLVWQAQW